MYVTQKKDVDGDWNRIEVFILVNDGERQPDELWEQERLQDLEISLTSIAFFLQVRALVQVISIFELKCVLFDRDNAI